MYQNLCHDLVKDCYFVTISQTAWQYLALENTNRIFLSTLNLEPDLYYNNNCMLTVKRCLHFYKFKV